MAGFEDLIRKALAQQPSTDAASRNTIYASSRQALERMLGQNTSLSPEQVTAQRERLEAAIKSIEAEYAPAGPAPGATPITPPAAPPPPKPSTPSLTPSATPPAAASTPAAPVAAPVSQAPKAPPPPPMPRMRTDGEPAELTASRVAPTQSSATLGGMERNAPGSTPGSGTAPTVPPSDRKATRPVSTPPTIGEPVALSPERPLEDYTEEYRDELMQKRKPYAKLLLWTIILVGLAVSIWWAITFGPALLKRQLDGSVPNPATTIESGSFVPGGGEGWLTAFLPAEDSQNVDTEGRGTADLFQNPDATFLRMASNAGSTANTIRIKMPPGIMQAVRGKVATFELTMRGPQGDGHQFAVFCEFGPMGECGRKRFRIRDKVEAFVFDVLVNDVALPSSQDAYLVINTDLSSSGKSVDLLAIRARTGE